MKKVLIVDDSSTIRDQIKLALVNPDIIVIEAVTGVEALSLLSSNTDICLIISDVNMPEMDGITMIKQIASNPLTNKIPIVMLTTEVGKDLKDVAKACGVRAWMVKPFTNEKLLMAVTQLTK